MYRIDSKTQFLSQRKLVSYGDLTLVGERFLAQSWFQLVPPFTPQLHNNL